MVATALILLATDPPSPVSQQQMVVLVLVIICRELTMSALREWAAGRGKGARKVCLSCKAPWQPLHVGLGSFSIQMRLCKCYSCRITRLGFAPPAVLVMPHGAYVDTQYGCETLPGRMPVIALRHCRHACFGTCSYLYCCSWLTPWGTLGRVTMTWLWLCS